MRTRWVAAALVILAVMAVADTARAQAPRRTLTIGMPVTPPNLPHLGVYVAKELGYFEEEGINLDLASFESGLQSLRGGVAGSVDPGSQRRTGNQCHQPGRENPQRLQLCAQAHGGHGGSEEHPEVR